MSELPYSVTTGEPRCVSGMGGARAGEPEHACCPVCHQWRVIGPTNGEFVRFYLSGQEIGRCCIACWAATPSKVADLEKRVAELELSEQLRGQT